MDLADAFLKIQMLEKSLPDTTRPEVIYARSMLMMAEVTAKGLMVAVDAIGEVQNINRRLAEIEHNLRQLLTPYHQALEESLVKPGTRVQPWGEKPTPRFEIKTKVPEPDRPEGELQTQEVTENEPAAFNLDPDAGTPVEQKAGGALVHQDDPDDQERSDRIDQIKQRIEARNKAVGDVDKVDNPDNSSTDDQPGLDALDLDQPPDEKKDVS